MDKTKRVNQLKVGVVLSYITTIANMIIKLVYTPVMLRLVGQSEYGLYTLVGSVVSYLSLFSLGFSGAYLRFYSKYVQDDNRDGIAKLNGMFLCAYLVMSLAALISGLTMAQFTPAIFGDQLTSDELSKARILMTILVINVAVTFPSSIFNSIISAHEQFIFQRLLTLLSVIFNPLIALPLLMMGYGSIAMVSVTTGITIAKLLLDVWFCLGRIRAPFKFTNFESVVLKEIFSFSFFIFLNMIIDEINWATDKFILGRVAGTTAVATYGVGATINTLYKNFSSTISSVFAPRVNRIAAANEEDRNNQFTKLFTKVGRVQFIVLGLILSGFVVFGKDFILHIYAGKEYGVSFIVALLLMAPATVPLIQNLGLEIQRSINKHRVRSIVYAVMAIINISISIPLARLFGSAGAALGTAISLILANGIFMNIYYHKAIGINISSFWKSIGSLAKGLIIPAAFGCFLFLKVSYTGFVRFVVWILLYTIVYFFSMYILGMNQYEKNLIIRAWNRVFWRNRSK